MFCPTCTCPWSAVTSSTAPAGQLLEHVADQAIDGAQLRRRRRRRSRARGRSCRCRRSRRTRSARRHPAGRRPPPAGSRSPPAHRAAPAQVGGGEARALQLGLADHRHARRGTAGTAAWPPARWPAGVAAGRRAPAQHVQHLAGDVHAIAHQAVLARGEPGGDRGEGGGRGGGRDGGDRATLHRCQRGREVAPGLELLPAEAVDHQQHHLPGAAHQRRAPRRPRRSPRTAASSAGTMPRTLAPP